MNTELTYMYRDASNYKFFGSVIISGTIAVSELRDYLYETEYFIPECIGLKSLAPSETNKDDHVWHELVGTKQTQEDANFVSAEKLKELFRRQYEAEWTEFFIKQYALGAAK